MSAPPTGTVTFLFTDIEGTTKLAQQFPNALPAALARHHVILHQAIESHHGHVFQVIGDAFCAAFATAPDALAAAFTAQRALQAESWGETSIRVRMGLHTGSAVARDGDYHGYLTLAYVQRLMSAAHGGQVILSAAAALFVSEQLPSDASLRDLGDVRLKDFPRLERVYQLLATNMPAEFPPLRLGEADNAEQAPPVSLLEHLARGQLIGRRREMEQLQERWAQAQIGHGQLVLISGEPGVGKTRLAYELIAHAQRMGASILHGGCYEYEATTPYLPFIEALRAHVHESNANTLRAQMGATAAELAKLAPEIESKLGTLSPNATLPAHEERLRLFDNVARFLRTLAGTRGLVLFIDDLQWVDHDTLALLQYVLRSLRADRLLVLASYREMELERKHPLKPALIEWNRERLATRLALARLTLEDTNALLAALLERSEVSAPFAEAIYRETEGNPFFVEEVVKSLIEQGELYREKDEWTRKSVAELSIPQSVRDVIGRRLDRLSERSRDAMHTAAALGRTFVFDELAATSTASEDELLDVLDEAATAQLLRSERNDAFTFVHEKIRETLYEELNAVRRRRLHLRIAVELEKLYTVGPAERLAESYGRLAYHYSHAAQKEKASEYLFKAGQRAAGLFATQTALDYYDRALELTTLGDGREQVLADRAKLLLEAFRGRGAAADYEQLLLSARQNGNERLELDALLGLGRAAYIIALDDPSGEFPAQSRAHYEAAYTLARRLEDRPAMVRALVRTARLTDFWPDYATHAEANAREALALSRETGDAALILESRLALRGFLPHPEIEHESEALASELKTRRDLPRLNELYFWLMVWHSLWGNFERSLECSAAGFQVAKEIGVPPVQYATVAAWTLMQQGHYDESWAMLQREIADEAHPFGRAFRDFGLGLYYLQVLANGEAAAVFEQVIEQGKTLSRGWMQAWGQTGRSQALLRGGRSDSSLLDSVPESDGIRNTRRLEVQTELLLVQEQWEEALSATETFATRAMAQGYRPDFIIAKEMQLNALLGLRRPADVLPVAEETLKMAEQIGYRPLIWRIRIDRALAYDMLGDSGAALADRRAARAIVEDLAGSIPDAQHKQGFLFNPLVASLVSASTPDTSS